VRPSSVIHYFKARANRAQQVNAPELVHDFAKIIRDEPIIFRVTVGCQFRDFPTRQVAMDSVQKRNHLQEIG